MSRLIFIFSVAAIIYLLIKSFRKNASPVTPPLAEDMVRCAHCGVHLPVGESVSQGGLQFCSAEHRDLHQG